MPSLDTRFAPLPFTCTYTHDRAGAAWVHPVGELDIATTGIFGAALEAASASAPRVYLDLRGLTFIDSAGVRFVADARRAAARAGCHAIAVADEQQAHVFALTDTSAELDRSRAVRRSLSLA